MDIVQYLEKYWERKGHLDFFSFAHIFLHFLCSNQKQVKVHSYFICALFLILWLLHYNTFASPPLKLQIVALDVKQSTSQLFLFVCSCVCVCLCAQDRNCFGQARHGCLCQRSFCVAIIQNARVENVHTLRGRRRCSRQHSSCELHLRVGWSHTVMLDIQFSKIKSISFLFLFFRAAERFWYFQSFSKLIHQQYLFIYLFYFISIYWPQKGNSYALAVAVTCIIHILISSTLKQLPAAQTVK